MTYRVTVEVNTGSFELDQDRFEDLVADGQYRFVAIQGEHLHTEEEEAS